MKRLYRFCCDLEGPPEWLHPLFATAFAVTGPGSRLVDQAAIVETKQLGPVLAIIRDKQLRRGSVQPQLGDVAGVLSELAALDFLDDVDEPLIGASLNPDALNLIIDN